MNCPNCNSERAWRNGIREDGTQRYKCGDCNYRFVAKSGIPVKKTFTKSKNMGISEEQFRKKHDVVFILAQVMEKLEEGILYEKSDVTQSDCTAGYRT